MRTQRNPVAMRRWRGAALLGLLLAATACGGSVASTGVSSPQGGVINVPVSASAAAPTIAVSTQPGRFMYGSADLRGATNAQFAQFAQDWTRHQLKAVNAPEVLLAQVVTPDQLPRMGLGCPPVFVTVEEPPLMVAILRGEFDFRRAAPGFGNIPAPIAGTDRYVMYVFDVWSGRPVVITTSEDGAEFKQALHDSSIPDKPAARLPVVCGTAIPTNQRHLHYGDFAPGMVPPTAVPPGSIPPTQPPMPPPVSTIVPVALTPGVKP